MASLDPHQRPPEHLQKLYKKYQKITLQELDGDSNVIDFSRAPQNNLEVEFEIQNSRESSKLFHDSLGSSIGRGLPENCRVIEPKSLPGLHIIPALLSSRVQWDLLESLLHRDLADSRHNTNLHKHYHVDYNLCKPQSFSGEGIIPASESPCDRSFFHSPVTSAVEFVPLDPAIHKPLTIDKVLKRKLRWITIGGQYDWSEKRYPVEEPPTFPKDVANIICATFPEVRPEAAIVNLYSPGDALSLHRDVSEKSDKGLVSISLGCDGLFIIGLKEEAKDNCSGIVIRLRSGDAVFMTGRSRYAWHGVSQVLGSTCPPLLKSWPALADQQGLPTSTGPEACHKVSGSFESWRGWLSNKRINLNVRQMNP